MTSDDTVPSYVDAGELNARLRQEPWMSREIAQGIEGIRRVRQTMERFIGGPGSPTPTRVIDVGVPVRTFEVAAPSAVYISIHGGGWILGSAEMDDVANAHRAATCGVSVAAIDYRLVPEVSWQTVVDDCTDVARHLLEAGSGEFGTSKVILGGTSAGATICVQMLLRLRQEGLIDSILGANLTYGVYDFGMTPSQRQWSDNLVIDPDYLNVTRPIIFPGTTEEDRRDCSISPLYADLSGLPPALFTVGSLDPFLDDSLYMTARWKSAGNRAAVVVYPDSPHGFARFPTRTAAELEADTDDFIHACAIGQLPEWAMT
jgi:acetyl esterase